jgi:hypothetical protein
MNKGARLAVAIGVTVLVVAAGAYLVRDALYPHEMERNPPKLDGVKRAIMDEIHIEANVTTNADLGSEDTADKVTVTFMFVPPALDKGDTEHRVRDLVKAYLPKAHDVEVRFGDNMRTKPLDIEDRTQHSTGAGAIPKGPPHR